MMSKKLLNISFLATATIALLLPSCTPGSCFEETNAYVKATFYLESSGKADAPDSLTLYGIGRDTSTIYSKNRNLSQALIPLDASTEGCGFVMKIDSVYDTISFTYTTYLHMLSKDCGYTFYHTIDIPVYTTNIIDTVTIVKSSITTFSEENIRIYY